MDLIPTLICTNNEILSGKKKNLSNKKWVETSKIERKYKLATFYQEKCHCETSSIYFHKF